VQTLNKSCLNSFKVSTLKICIDIALQILQNMYDVTWYIVDNDNVGGWFPPSDNSGKIFVTVRNWTTDQHHTQPTYDDAEDFM
jgi:hypothetical protein